MDRKDKQILDFLKKDGRASYTQIAENLNVSEGTVRNRIQKMQEQEVIEKFTVEIAKNQSEAVVMIKLQTGKAIEKILSSFPENLEIYEVTGEYDLVAKIARSSNKEINNVLDQIRELEGIEETETYMILNKRK